MYAYTSKQILVGKGRKVSALTFDPSSDILAMGFENGLIKVIKFEETQNEENEFEIIMNEKLKHSHSHPIQTLSWNSQYGKLLSVDTRGLLIVWTESEETYIEEMVNESDKKRIKFAKWSKNGTFILIILEGGGAILGNVDGERIWSKDLSIEIEFLDWIENDKTIVLSDKKGELVALDTKSSEIFAEYDVSQEQSNSQNDNNLMTKKSPEDQIYKKEWRKKSTITSNFEDDSLNMHKISQELIVFDGNTLEAEHSRLILCYKSGEVYLIYNLRECDMKKFFFGFNEIIAGIWNKEGNGFALSVRLMNDNFIYLFDNQGEILFSFNSVVPIRNLDFNHFANKLMLADQDRLYLTKIKKKYKYCYLSEKSVFVFMMESLDIEKTVFFYNIINKSLKKKIFPKAIDIFSNSVDKLIIISESFVFKDNYEVKLMNYNGAILDSIILILKPSKVVFNEKRCVFYNTGKLFIWDFSKSFKNNSNNVSCVSSSKLFYFDLLDPSKIIDLTQNWKIELQTQKVEHSIESIDVTKNNLYLCNEKGFIRIFCLNNFVEQNPVMLKYRPIKIAVNKNESYIAMIDFEKNLRIQSLNENNKNEEIFFIEEVWEFFWSPNNDYDFYFIKQNELYEQNIEEESQKNAKKDKCNKKEKKENFIKTDLYLLGITFPNIVMFDIENFEQIVSGSPADSFDSIIFTQQHLINKIKDIELNIKTQKDVTFESLLKNTNKENNEVIKYIAESFLMKGNYDEACKAYRSLNNYSALKFIQRLKDGFENEVVKKAQAFFFLQKKQEAISFLLKHNKENLLLKLLEDNHQFEEMLEYENLLDAETLNRVFNKLGEKFEKEKNFKKSISYYEKSSNYEKLIPLYCLNNNFDKLANICEMEKNQKVLELLANYLVKFNLIDSSARIFEKIQKPKKSVDIAILHNYWDTAVEIAEKNNFQQIDNLLNKFANILKQKNKKMEVVQLYRKAKKNLEAAKMLNSIAEDLIKQNMNALLVKKVFVLSALEINLENKKRFNPNLTANLTNLTLSDQTKNNTLNTLNTLITSDVSSIGEKILINPWKGAEAWHLYLLALNFLKQRKFKEGYIITQKLVNYELELGQKRIFILGAIFSRNLGFFKQFSKCLSKLENYYLEKNNFIMLKKIENFTIEIFTNKEPIDEEIEDIEILDCIGKNCKSYITELDSFCMTCGSNFGICMVSGRSVFSKNYYKCRTCKHKLLNEEIKRNNLKFCSLCHSKINITTTDQNN